MQSSRDSEYLMREEGIHWKRWLDDYVMDTMINEFMKYYVWRNRLFPADVRNNEEDWFTAIDWFFSLSKRVFLKNIATNLSTYNAKKISFFSNDLSFFLCLIHNLAWIQKLFFFLFWKRFFFEKQKKIETESNDLKIDENNIKI